MSQTIRPRPEQHSSAAGVYTEVEAALRVAGRGLEYLAVADPEAGRLAGVCFRLAQRVAVDAGRLERAA